MEYFDKLKDKLGKLDLEESKVDELVEFSKKAVPKDFVPSNELTKVKDEFKAFKDSVEEKDELINNLKEKAESVEEYEEKINKIMEEKEKIEQEAKKSVSRIKKQTMFKDALIENNANPKLVDLILLENKDNLDDMKIDEDDGKLIGQEDYINKIKEKRSDAFLKENVDTPTPEEGDGEVEEEFADIDAAMGLK